MASKATNRHMGIICIPASSLLHLPPTHPDINEINNAIDLTLKALAFLLPVQHWGGGGVFSTPSVKLDPEILES